MLLRTYLQSFVKIGSVIVEIFLIWTNVTRTNVAWTNVIVTVGICSRCSQESIFKVSSKSGPEIFLIWTNVARTNVARTNVTITVGICSRCSQEPTFQVSSKLGQLELRYS